MKIYNLRTVALMGAILALTSCAETPMGPQVQMTPPPGKTFEQFLAEKQDCQKYAANDVQGQASHHNKKAALGGLLATGAGAGLGAAGGALGGGLGATSYSEGKQGGIQTQYDQTYTACMVARGNKMSPNAVVVQPNGGN